MASWKRERTAAVSIPGGGAVWAREAAGRERHPATSEAIGL
jgi:hypothetical protein